MRLHLIALALIAGFTVSAQNVSFGPSIGFGHSWLTGVQDVKFKPGINIGGTLVYSFTPHWGIGGDIRASFLEGVKYAAPGNENSTLNATYLRIPVKLFYFFGDYGDRLHPKLYAGPSAGFLLGGKNKPFGGSETKASNVLKTFDFGLIAGAGLNYRIKTATWLNLDIAYTNGLLDVSKSDAFNSNRNLSLNVGITFPFGTIKN